MALTTRQDHTRWPDAATPAALPNVSGSPTQDSDLELGHTCFSVSDTTLYVCTNDAVGAAVWAGTNQPSLPGIQQVLFVDKTSGSYTADGTVQNPFSSINAALTAALALTPSTTNRIEIHVLPGIYDEYIRLRDYCYVVGSCKESCIISHNAAHLVLASSVRSGIWNMTVQTTGNYYLSWLSGTSYIEYHNCVFKGNSLSNNVFYITDTTVIKCYECEISNPDPDRASMWLYDDFVAEFYHCLIEGYPYIEGGSSDASFLLKDCRVVASISSWGSHHFAAYDTEVDCSTCVTWDWPFNFRALEASVKLQNCVTKTNGLSTIRDIWANAQMDVDCTNCRLEMGSDGSVWIGSPQNEVHVGGGVDQYHLFEEMLLANWASRGVITAHLHKDDVTTGIDVGSAHDKIIVDGHGHTLGHSTPGTTIPLSTGRGSGEEWLFKNLHFGDSLSAAVPGVGISTVHQLRDVVIDGALKLSVGAETGDLEVELDHVKGWGNATDSNAVQLNCGAGTQPKLLVTGDSYLQGQVGSPAIYWHTGAGYGDLRMVFSTILHGSLGANNPMGDDGTPVPPIPYAATHCRFNADPDLGNFGNVVALAQRFNSFDPLVAF